MVGICNDWCVKYNYGLLLQSLYLFSDFLEFLDAFDKKQYNFAIVFETKDCLFILESLNSFLVSLNIFQL